MKTFSLQTRLYSGQGSLAVLKRFTNKHIWIICDGFPAAGNPASGVARR